MVWTARRADGEIAVGIWLDSAKESFCGVQFNDRGVAETLPEFTNEGLCFRAGAGGDSDGNLQSRAQGCGRLFGELGGVDGEAYALGGAIGAAREVGDGEISGGGSEYGAGRGHAIEEAEDFELGFEFVGDAIDGEICFADGVFDGAGKADEGQVGGA